METPSASTSLSKTRATNPTGTDHNPSQVGFLYLIPNFLRMKEAHESPGKIAQRFDHPHPGVERTHPYGHRCFGSKSNRNVATLLNDGDREMPRDDLKAMLRYADAAAVSAWPTAR